MSVQEDLAVQYYQQDTDYYCGAACTQMVLTQISAGRHGFWVGSLARRAGLRCKRRARWW